MIDHTLNNKDDKAYVDKLFTYCVRVVLYPAFFFSNLNGIGIVLVYLHDFGDVFISLLKASIALKWNGASNVCFPLVLLSWLGTRCLILYWYIWDYCLLTKNITEFPASKTDLNSKYENLKMCCLIALTLIQISHIIWFFKLMLMYCRGSYLDKKTRKM